MARFLLLALLTLLALPSLAAATVVISEVLADLPSGLAGDANGDCKRDGYEDEFIELYNAGADTIDISGWRLADNSAEKYHFKFPDHAVIAPHSYIVLFGGGKPSGFTVPVYIDDGKIGRNGLTGTGEKIHLIKAPDDTVAIISHDNWPKKQSLVRHPLDSEALVPHITVSTIKAPFSPGTTHIIPKPNYPIFISEVLADPPSGLAGDANRDGKRDTYEDEFIELYNAGSTPISLAGWWLRDSSSNKYHFQFPANAVIAPHSYILVFGGGNPRGFIVPVYTNNKKTTYKGRIGNGLTGKGEVIRLIDKIGHEIDVVSHDEWPKKQSFVRKPPNGGPFVPHKTASPAGLPFSPGQTSITRPVRTYPLFISEVLADPPGDANRDGKHDPHQDEFIELYNAGPVTIPLADWRLGDAGPLSSYFRFPRRAAIAPRSYVVLFGGGKPTGFTIPVYTDDGTIGDGLTNSGESIHLIDNHGHEAASLVHHSTWPNAQSLIRTPPDGDALVPHQTTSPLKAPFSPGHAPTVRPLLTYPLFISEVLADPPEGWTGDANQDGRADPHQDEFIELYNAGSTTVDIGGWRLGDAGPLSGYFRFPRRAAIAPRSYVVLFGGGNPSGFTIPVYTDDGTIGDGLTNSGESIHLISARGDEVAFLFHSTWPDAQSLVRTRPNGGALVPHQTASPTEAPFSPGHAPDKPPKSAAKIPATSLQVWPNPFNTTTHLRFHLNRDSFVHVAIYNIQGQRIRTLVDAPLPPGAHRTRWDGQDDHGHSVATGPYFARFHIERDPPHYAKLVLLR